MRTHGQSDNLAFLLLLAVASTCSERICELQGTCRKCSLNRYSFYTCHTSADCFPGEHCTKERFCCPAERSPKDATSRSRLAGSAFAASSLDSQIDEGPLCPDSSGWLRMCKVDADCIFKDEICAEGKCCPSCRQRRAQALGEMANGQRSGDDGVEGGRILFSRDDEGTIAVTGLYIPQCHWEMQEGRHYRPLQCRHGTNECWCVDRYGRQLHVNHTIHKQDRIDCAEIRRRVEQQGSGGVEAWTNKSTDVGLDDVVGGEGEGEVLEVGRDGIHHYESSSQQCEDPLREFKFCGSSCPISCATIRVPRCQQDQCTRGCFCRLPYVLVDGTNPFESRCVLPAECPMLPFTSELNSWNGGFFPALVPRDSQAQSQQDHPPEDGDHSSLSLPRPIVSSSPPSSSNLQSPSERCADPLKNYQTCGSHCPISCDQRTRPTGCNRSCLAGCFCRVPYILREQSMHAPCILPQYCPPPSGHSITASSPTPTTPADSTIPHYVIKNPEGVGNNTEVDGKGAKKCREPNKEFLSCVSSCPLGCDHLEAQQCTPCVSGCFCKNGYVFENASDWRNSLCIPSSRCSSRAGITDISAERTTLTTLSHTAISADGHECPSSPVDRNGRSCNSDFECGFQQGCCPFHSRLGLLVNETTNPLYKCTCLDPNAIWVECGTNCPDYCGAPPEHGFCPQICRPGCFCASGYVKATKESNSLCIPTTKCPLASTSPTTQRHQFPFSSPPPITPVRESSWSTTSAQEPSTEKSEQNETDREDECGNALASAVLYSKSGKRLGRLLVRPDRRQRRTENHRVRITGDLDLLSSVDSANATAASRYAISLHQFSDTTTGDCKGVGAALALNVLDEDDNGLTNPAAPNLELKKTGRSSFSAGNEMEVVIKVDYTLRWGDPISPGTNPLIGHSVVLKKNSRDNSNPIVLACAVLGIVPSC